MIGDFMGIMGLLGFIICFIWIVLNLIRRKKLKVPAVLLVAALFIFSIGIAVSSPTNDVAYDNGSIEEVDEEAVIEYKDIEPEVEDIDENNDLEEPDDPKEELAEERALPAGQLEVHFIDVGQGDSIYIKTATQNILIDGGNRGNEALNYLRNQGVRSLDLVIGTHPHADHIGGLINVMQAMPVKEVIDPAVVHTTKTFEDYLTIIDEKDIRFTEGRAGMSRDLGGGVSMHVLHPTSPSKDHLNDASIVVRITFGEISFLFTGDAERSSEQQMLSRGANLNSDILKVGHHGSRTSTTKSFLNAVSPSSAVIMCGRDNQYGHPHDETLANLSNAGVDIYRTDLHGSIVITTDGLTYQVNKEPLSYQEQSQPSPQAEAPAVVETVEGKYVGSRNSDRYHYPSCGSANRIKPENRVWFNSTAEARAKGYVPCGNCRPPQ